MNASILCVMPYCLKEWPLAVYVEIMHSVAFLAIVNVYSVLHRLQSKTLHALSKENASNVAYSFQTI